MGTTIADSGSGSGMTRGGWCVIAEIDHLNGWNKRFEGTLRAYFMGASPSYLKDMDARFEYEQVENVRNVFSATLPVGNPVVALVDTNGYVQAIQTNDLSRPGSDRRRDQFYERAHSLVSAFYE